MSTSRRQVPHVCTVCIWQVNSNYDCTFSDENGGSQRAMAMDASPKERPRLSDYIHLNGVCTG